MSLGTRASVWSYRKLVWSFAERDLKSKYRGTLFGWVWALLLPLATVLIYTVVFSVVFRAEPPPFGNGKPGNYAVWLLVGLVTWSFFAVAISSGIPNLLGAGVLLQKVYIPSVIPVVGSAIATASQTLIEFGILLVILIIFVNIGWTWLLLPFILALLFVFVVALTTGLAILNVYARDVQQIVTVIVQLMFFLTPIIYPITIVPESWHGIPVRTVMSINPMAQFVEATRDVLYHLRVPTLGQTAMLLGWTLAAVLFARLVYVKLGPRVGESI